MQEALVAGLTDVREGLAEVMEQEVQRHVSRQLFHDSHLFLSIT